MKKIFTFPSNLMQEMCYKWRLGFRPVLPLAAAIDEWGTIVAAIEMLKQRAPEHPLTQHLEREYARVMAYIDSN